MSFEQRGGKKLGVWTWIGSAKTIVVVEWTTVLI